MTKARSPRYPVIGLAEAIEKTRLVYAADYQNRIPKRVIAEHMGYGSLNGKSLGVISAVIKYGLLEGRANEMRVSDEGLTIVAHEPGSAERIDAIRAAARRPDLFAELDSRFPDGKASDSAIRSYLLTQRKFLPNAADVAIRAFRETQELINTESINFGSTETSDSDGSEKGEKTIPQVGDLIQWEVDGILRLPAACRVRSIQEHEGSDWVFIDGSESAIPLDEVIVEQKRLPVSDGSELLPPTLPVQQELPSSGVRKEVASLDEGDAVLTWPEELSADSYIDLKAWLDGILRKARRRAGIKEERGGHLDA